MKNLPDKIIVHHSASDIAAHDDISTIDQWHKERGFKAIYFEKGQEKTIHCGYHYYIQKDGTVQHGRPLFLHGAHCKGQNTSSVGICLGGDKHFSEAQFKALSKLIRQLWQELEVMPIFGHYQFDTLKASCPGFSLDRFIADYLAYIK